MSLYAHKVTPAITVETAAYTSGDVVAAAVSIGNVVAVAGGQIYLDGANLAEDGGQTPSLTFMFFNQQPGQSAVANDPPVWGANDDDYFAGQFSVSSSDWKTYASHSFLSIGDMNVPIDMGSSTELYMIILADGAYDAVAANGLRLTLHFKGAEG